MARIDSGAGVHIKEDCVITVITIEDAITDIIALLVLILLRTLTIAEQRKREKEEVVLDVSAITLL